MKVWSFFRVPENIKEFSGLSARDKFPLYAVTNNKEYADAFKKGRLNNAFICKTEKLDKYSARGYLNSHRGKVLNYKSLRVFESDDYNKEVRVLMTEDEGNILDEVIESHGLFANLTYISPDIFTKKIVKLLWSIDYCDTYSLFTGNSVHVIDFDFPNLDATYNELWVFVYMSESTIDLDKFSQTIKYT